MKAYDRLMLARDPERPGIQEYVEALFTDFYELCGDRSGGEDPAILGGIALFEGEPVTVIGHRKGHTPAQRQQYRFGMPNPEGYRKALRLMQQAERFHRPVITLIDTPGAFPGKDAEEHGQSSAIAEAIAGMSALQIPVISIVTGEGNSGGALAIGVANEIWMLENAVYSVLSPEGFASILWKDAARSREACETMQITSDILYRQGIADAVIPEPEGGIQRDPQFTYRLLREKLQDRLHFWKQCSPEQCRTMRDQKYRKL